MTKIIYLLFISIFSLEYLSEELGPQYQIIVLLPDLLSGIALVAVVISVAVNKTLSIHYKYIIFGSLLILDIIFGIILNQPNPGAVFAGLRNYFRYLPFFLVPFVFSISEDTIRSQLKLLLLLAILQFPVVIYQRFVEFAGVSSGDPISGTLMVSNTLSIVLVSAIAVLTGFYVRKRISSATFFLLVFMLFIPTALNETKVTLFILPIAIIVPAIMYALRRKRYVELFSALFGGALLLAVLYGGYSMLYSTGAGSDSRSIDKFLFEGGMGTYLYHEEEADSQTGEFKSPGRIDTMIWAVQKLSGDVTKLAFGLGIGNVSKSFSPKFTGEYRDKYAYLSPQQTTFGYLLWEIGIIGLISFLVLVYFIYSDARYLSDADSIIGTLSLGWVSVTVIFIACLPYRDMIAPTATGYMFWYLSGYIVSSRQRLREPGVRDNTEFVK